MEKILQAIGDPTKELEVVSNYEQFKSHPDPKQFAVIKIGGGLVDDSYQRRLIAQDLAVLHQVGLYPTVVHGAGPQLDRQFEELEIETPKVSGIRKTPKTAQGTLVNTVMDVGVGLKNEIWAWGGAAKYILPHDGVLEASLSDTDNIASVEDVDVYTGPINSAVNSKLIPLLGSVGLLATPWRFRTGEFRAVNINADKAAGAIAVKLCTQKYISLTETGGVLNTDGELISELSTVEATEKIMSGEIYGGMVPKVMEALWLIAQGIGSVAITSPKNLLIELFTDAGQGTLIT